MVLGRFLFFLGERFLGRITSDIIRLVLAEENMNREKTARRLDISRSTLWRTLKNQ